MQGASRVLPLILKQLEQHMYPSVNTFKRYSSENEVLENPYRGRHIYFPLA